MTVQNRVIYFVEVGYYAAGGARYVGYATQDYDRDGDDPAELANADFWSGRVSNPGSYMRSVFRGGGGGSSEAATAKGSVTLMNNDGGLDWLLDEALDGWPLRIMRATLGEDDRIESGSLVVLLDGAQDQPQIGYKTVTLRLRDAQAEFGARPMLTERFDGSSIAEGSDNGTVGQVKAKGWGAVYESTPILVNDGLLLYYVARQRIQSITAVKNGGDPVTASTVYSTLTALVNATVTAGTFVAYLGDDDDGSYFRLGTAPDRLVTCTFTGDYTGASYVETAADIASRIAQTEGGLAASSVDSTAMAALNTANSAAIGLWLNSDTTVASALNSIVGSVGAWWGFTRAGLFYAKRLELPTLTDTATLELDADDLITPTGGEPLVYVPGTDLLSAPPVFQVTVGYRPIYGVQAPAELVGTATPSTQEFFAAEYRFTPVAELPEVQNIHRLATSAEFLTLMANKADALIERDRLLTQYSTRRWRYEATVRPSLVASLELGDIVKITLPRLGCDNGRLFVVLGVDESYSRDVAVLDLWGGVRVPTVTVDRTDITVDSTETTMDAFAP